MILKQVFAVSAKAEHPITRSSRDNVIPVTCMNRSCGGWGRQGGGVLPDFGGGSGPPRRQVSTTAPYGRPGLQPRSALFSCGGPSSIRHFCSHSPPDWYVVSRNSKKMDCASLQPNTSGCCRHILPLVSATCRHCCTASVSSLCRGTTQRTGQLPQSPYLPTYNAHPHMCTPTFKPQMGYFSTYPHICLHIMHTPSFDVKILVEKVRIIRYPCISGTRTQNTPLLFTVWEKHRGLTSVEFCKGAKQSDLVSV